MGDTFDYYNSNNGMSMVNEVLLEGVSIGVSTGNYGTGLEPMASGNKSYTKVLSLRVIRTSCVLKDDSGNVIDIFDYECEEISPSGTVNPFLYNTINPKTVYEVYKSGQPYTRSNWNDDFTGGNEAEERLGDFQTGVRAGPYVAGSYYPVNLQSSKSFMLYLGGTSLQGNSPTSPSSIVTDSGGTVDIIQEINNSIEQNFPLGNGEFISNPREFGASIYSLEADPPDLYMGPFENNSSIKFDYQLPYTAYDGTSIHQRVIIQGINSDMTIRCFDMYKGTSFNVSKENIFLDYYKFSNQKLTTDAVTGPNYGLCSGVYSVYLQYQQEYPQYASPYGTVGFGGLSFYQAAAYDGGTGVPPLPSFVSPTYESFTTGSLNLSTKDTSDIPFNNNMPSAMNSISVSTTYSGDAIRAGILDTMVLTGTNMTNTNGQTAFVNLTVTGKPYGSEFFLSQPQDEMTTINRQGFGRIEKFSISETRFPVGTVLRSGKGFNIEFAPSVPVSYSFKSSQSPSQEISTFDASLTYSENDLVSYENTNLRQYLRNYSEFSIPYLENPNTESELIPYVVQGTSSGQYTYPVFTGELKNRTSIIEIDGKNFYYDPDDVVINKEKNDSNFLEYSLTESEKISNLVKFKIVPKTIYPENNFVVYSKNSDYAKGEIVSSVVDDTNFLYRSLESRNYGNDVSSTSWWQPVSLTQNLSSYGNNYFYSRMIEGNDFSDYIEDLKYLNNQNLPALVSKLSTAEEKCPELCTLANEKTKYEDTFLQLDCYNDIRYLFLNPVLLQKPGTSSMISLANSPVAPAQYYNVGFLGDGGARKDYLSQYMYLVDLENQEERFNKQDCTGNLFITQETGASINTNVSKFSFANSVLFNFSPCDIESQDFIKYKVKPGSSSGTSVILEAMDYPSTYTPNIFPPTLTQVPLIVSSKGGTCFQQIDGSFDYTHFESGVQGDPFNYLNNIPENNYPITLGGTSGTSIINIENIVSGKVIATHTTSISGSANYGDIWYDYSSDVGSSYPFGFIIPEGDSTNIFIGARSFMQLNRNYNFSGNGLSLFPSSSQLSGINQGEEEIISFGMSFDASETYTDGTYSNSTEGVSFYIKTHENLPLDQKEAILTTSTQLSDAEYIYLPTYDINSCIKAKAVCVFGENYIGKAKYTLDKENSIMSLNNKLLTTLIFEEFKNNLLLSDEEKKKTQIFTGVSTSSADNLQDTFIIKFEGSSFSLRPNPFEKPIFTLQENRLLINQENLVSLDNPVGYVNTDSTTKLIAEGLSSFTGTSVMLSFEDFAKFNEKYTDNGSCIPGRTNIQVQFSEIRQNRTKNYIQDNNQCSVYFQPAPGVGKTRITSATWEMLFSGRKYKLYTGTSKSGDLGPRFYSKPKPPLNNMYFLKNDTRLNLKGTVTVYLGCNLLYKFDQSDPSNTEPVVFSDKKYSESVKFSTSDQIDIKTLGNQRFTIQYYIDGYPVSYSNYSSSFDTATQRYVEISYLSDFDNNDFEDAKIYFGIPTKPYYASGGMIKFNYH